MHKKKDANEQEPQAPTIFPPHTHTHLVQSKRANQIPVP